jgi:hypothetical protein
VKRKYNAASKRQRLQSYVLGDTKRFVETSAARLGASEGRIIDALLASHRASGKDLESHVPRPKAWYVKQALAKAEADNPTEQIDHGD